MSTVVLDTITGKSTATTITIGSTPVVSASANSMTIRGEGSNQTSIQQGLAKHFTIFKGTDTFAGIDNFNQSSIADVGTGLHRTSFTSNFGSINYTVTGSIVGSVTSGYHAFIASDGGVKVTSSVDTLTVSAPDSTAAIDMDVVQLVSHGDLA
jgi:hypothetical protein